MCLEFTSCKVLSDWGGRILLRTDQTSFQKLPASVGETRKQKQPQGGRGWQLLQGVREVDGWLAAWEGK